MTTVRTPCGIAIPQTLSTSPIDVDLVRRFVSRAEELAFESLWVQEKIVGDYPVLEPMTSSLMPPA